MCSQNAGNLMSEPLILKFSGGMPPDPLRVTEYEPPRQNQNSTSMVEKHKCAHLTTSVDMSRRMTNRNRTNDLAVIQHAHLPRMTWDIRTHERIWRKRYGLCLSIIDDIRIRGFTICDARHPWWMGHSARAIHRRCNLKTWICWGFSPIYSFRLDNL